MSIHIQIKEKKYQNKHNNGSVTALKEIDVFIKTKEFVCLVGPSGCGKTTLMNIVGGLIKTDKQNLFFIIFSTNKSIFIRNL